MSSSDENKGMESKFYTVDDLSVLMNISRSYAYKLVKQNSTPFKVLKIGSRYIVPKNSFETWYNQLNNVDQQSEEIKDINE